MNKQKFSLIEIALSLGVAFLAITVLIAFFPTSFNRIKTAQETAYATNAAQQFSTYLKNELTTFPVPERYKTSTTAWNTDYQAYLDKWDAQINTAANTATSNSLPVAKYDLDDISYITSPYPIPSDFEGTHIVAHKTVPSVYLIRNITFLNGASLVDNTVEARIWKSPYVFGCTLFPGAPSTGSGGDPQNYDNNYSNAARINIELSWPVSLPYSQRKFKTHKFLDLAK